MIMSCDICGKTSAESILGSPTFAAALKRLHAPAPWRLCDEVVGVILAADGADVLTVDVNSERTDDETSELALMIVQAVNLCAGTAAESETPLKDPPRLAPDSEAELRQGKK